MTPDPFRTLGVPYSASQEEITEAWRVLVRDLHPDANPGANAVERQRLTARVAVVNAAHNELKADLAAARARWEPSPDRAAATGTAAQMWSEPPQLLPVRIPGAQLFRSPLAWVLMALALVLGLVFLNTAGNPSPARGPVTSTSLYVPAGWNVGNCLAGDGVVVPVRCSVDHSARITAQVGAEEYCPAGTDGTVYRDNVYFCVDTDQ